MQEKGDDFKEEELDRMVELIDKLSPNIKDTIKGQKGAYEEAKKEIDDTANEIIGDKGFVVPHTLKTPERATNKILRWYADHPNRLGDGARTNIVAYNDEDAYEIFNKIKEKYKGGILRNEFETTELGFPSL